MDNSQSLKDYVEGGTTIRDFDASLNSRDDHIGFIVPVYVRAGAVIPTIELEQYVGQLNKEGKANPITLNIYPGKEGMYTMYLDDGESRSSVDPDVHPKRFGGDKLARGENRKTQITHAYIDNTKKKREIRVKRLHDNYTPKFEDYFFVAILHDPYEAKGTSGCLQKVMIGEQEINFITGGSVEERSDTLKKSSSNAWYYNENNNVSFIKVFDNNPNISIRTDYV
jgi:alpha-glucosidase